MNPLKKGPELKMPQLKRPDVNVPGPVADLYYDLRDRRLLLPIALVVVAIAATPILLGSKPKVVPAPPAGGGIGAAIEAAGGRAARLTVVEARPGLREYSKRLGHRSPSDPFKQKYTSLPKSAQVQSSGSASVSEGGSPTVIESGTSETGEGGSTAPPESAPPAGGTVKKPRLIEFRFNLQISHEEIAADGSRKMSKLEARKHVRSLTQLPGKKTVVVTTGGVNLQTEKVLFLVSDEVDSLEGDFGCLTRTPNGICELLEIKPGLVLEAVYGPNKILYQFKVIGVEAVWVGRVGDKKTSGGKGSKGKSSQGSQARSRAAFAAQPRAALAGSSASLPRP